MLNGPGAAGTAIIKMLMTAGAKDIIAVDQFGTLYKGLTQSAPRLCPACTATRLLTMPMLLRSPKLLRFE